MDPPANDDRTRWNQKYEKASEADPTPSRLLQQMQRYFPSPAAERSTLALDLAGGAGRHAIWLAQLGYQTTLVDVSDRALAIANERVKVENIELQCVRRDVLQDGLPDGTWNLIVSILFLHRPLLPHIADALAPGGVFVMIQPTVSNLLRRRRPPKRFLLQDGELPALVQNCGLNLLHQFEGWSCDGRHDALVVARK